MDADLEACIHLNTKEKHVQAPLCHAVIIREGQSSGGLQMTEQLNSSVGTTELVITLPVQPHEGIVVGSPVFVADLEFKLTVVASGNTEQWQTTAKDSANFLQLGASKEDFVEPVPVPPFFLNSQFQNCDVFIAGSSVNGYLGNCRGTTGGLGALAIANHIANEPETHGICPEGRTDVLEGKALTGLPGNGGHARLSKSGDSVFVTERIYHQTNMPTNSLCSIDFDDEQNLKCWPPGVKLVFKLVTQGSRKQRTQICASNDSSKVLHGKFKTFQVFFHVVEFVHWPDLNTWYLATIDIGLDIVPLVADQTSATVHVTRAGHDVVPQFLILFVSTVDGWQPHKMTALGPKRTGNIAAARCVLNGSNMPDFMHSYIDGNINMSSPQQRSQMLNNWLGRGAGIPSPPRYFQRPKLERDILGNLPTGSQKDSILLVTDPSLTLVREASSGVTTGTLEIHVQLENVKGSNSCIWLQKLTKQQFSLMLHSGTWQVSPHETRPAFTVSSDSGHTSQHHAVSQAFEPM